MVDMYGEEFVEWLTDTKHSVVKWNRAELSSYIESLQTAIKVQEQRLI
jgi:hypothetical protein